MSDNVGQPVEIPVSEPVVREHLREILESRAFKGSRRSQQFLHHIVQRVLDGHPGELKERNLGIELFGRSPSYDTGEDAIVRVTAADLRKRLLQFYSEADPDIRIELHSGSYVPEFHRVAKMSAPVAVPTPPKTPVPGFPIWAALILIAVIALTGLSLSRASMPNVLPWSSLLAAHRRTVVVFSDPDISLMQSLTRKTLSLSDYANGRYLPDPKTFTPELLRLAGSLRGTNVPDVDVRIALSISSIAASRAPAIATKPARLLQMSDFKSDDNFILLGSPRSNPWGELFQNQLDFVFAYDELQQQEIIRNPHPRPEEPSAFVPTARGWATGRAYGIVALVGNPGQAGKTLLIAGTSAEATEAAGQLAANTSRLARALRECGVDPNGVPQHFEILIDVSTMAGSASNYEIALCHKLRGASQ